MHKLYILNFKILQSSIMNVQIRREFCWESAVKRIVKIGLHPRSYDQKSKSLFFIGTLSILNRCHYSKWRHCCCHLLNN